MSWRWWNLARWVFGLVGLAGLVGVCILVPADGPAERLNFALVGLVVGLAGCGYANHEYREARFALAHVSEGIVVSVHEAPRDSESPNFVMFWVDARLPDGTELHRRVDVHGWPDPQSWVGRTIRFRHRTVDPELLKDAYLGPHDKRVTLEQRGRS
ncbi:hypothetical protein M1247_35975 [Mycobacterium sp. 21AC1]|uniref:hypothetical protein n=1 Tax=[Mycobacterium] appelbergii TaxID=2939269 RepID=UPI002939265E|nr:hypothetical protein [Mycobacterium sp. 21AC1]MDV3130350.1 hypothetical protein [Mycobacterium sp. 21AC1]